MVVEQSIINNWYVSKAVHTVSTSGYVKWTLSFSVSKSIIWKGVMLSRSPVYQIDSSTVKPFDKNCKKG